MHAQRAPLPRSRGKRQFGCIQDTLLRTITISFASGATARQTGASDYIVKPVTFQMLIPRVQAAKNRHNAA